MAKKLTDRIKKVHLVDKEDNYSDDEYVISTLSTEYNNIDQKMSSEIILITPRVDGKLLRNYEWNLIPYTGICNFKARL